MKGFGMIDTGKVGWLDIPEPTLDDPSGVLIDITAVAPCTTDVHLVKSGVSILRGNVIGHEAIGIVSEVGESVKDFKKGDRVLVPDFSPNFGDFASQDGMANRSPNSSRMFDPNMDGLFTQRVLFKRADSGLAHIPDNVTDEQALMVADMVPTSFKAIDFLDVQFGETVAVIGIGPVGLTGVEGLSIKGAAKIIAVGSRPITKNVAKEYGASVILDYHDGPIVDQIIKANDGKKVDKVLIAGGNTDVVKDAFNVTRPGGKIANVAVFVVPELAIPTSGETFDIAYQAITIGAGRLFLERLLSLISYGRIHPERIITKTYHGFDKIPESFEYMTDKGPDTIKAIVIY
ncbi:alcohol dehydrogenase catalytic domain-containing protein [Bifidobacterium sp. ESL0732]|uniref:zinc-binding dehydrogenase n=1 Tax=Bifidobacterium sp. ESL0732 TaxID=2983222 RepID=UPI0023F70FEA|nr:alcohol dehydrogenase catalytic domain-containing protein [Bifidobacterium sp. ESL0732]WEV63665.1 alcohol dehydrogenase catalytic domain-containing protein [Bifidobacterium sp. ESL0732]